MKWIDLPPVWLFAALLASWGIDALLPAPSPGGWARVIGAILILGGPGLMAAAAREMSRARTTLVPRREPTSLVTSGVFAVSRNPIYLGDALLLTGVILWWQSLWALPLLGVFVWIIQRRFILPEEARLRAAFGEAFEAWAARTRRWI